MAKKRKSIVKKKVVAPKKTASPQVEIITDKGYRSDVEPILTVRTGQTGGETFFVKINQPKGRALLIAVHL